jgi:predicted ABC-type ATPase
MQLLSASTCPIRCKLPVSAGREVISQTCHYIELNQSFVPETTLSGNAAPNVMRKAKRQGFTMHLVYVYLEDLEMSIKRLWERAAQGGHFRTG